MSIDVSRIFFRCFAHRPVAVLVVYAIHRWAQISGGALDTLNTLSKNTQSYERTQGAVLAERLAEPRRFIQVLAGPRQVGKTTLVQQVVES
jgi:hypothetical protein